MKPTQSNPPNHRSFLYYAVNIAIVIIILMIIFNFLPLVG